MKKLLRILNRLLPFIGIGISLLMLLHSLWQLDIIAVRPIWDTKNWIKWFLSTGYSNFADIPFQCGFWFRTSLGNAYDFYLSLNVASWFLLAVSMWFWRRRDTKGLKKTLSLIEFGYVVLRNEGLSNWKIKVVKGDEGYCHKNTKTINFGERCRSFEIMLHEIAHCLTDAHHYSDEFEGLVKGLECKYLNSKKKPLNRTEDT